MQHFSRVFGEDRKFRVFLPPNYDQATERRYAVIYFFHGHGQRYNDWSDMPNGDTGSDYGGDNVASFVATHDVIVVRWDGFNPRTPGEQYIRPYNVGPVETFRQFPLYFPELVEYIDSHFRTLADRDHRATSGISMGGFMSFWIAGKYPHLVGSASNFMGSSEFEVGPKGFPVEYRHTEMYLNYEGVRTRIVVGKRDFIRWYHRRMNAVWNFTRPHHETAEFDSPHGTPGMAETLQFHMAAFRDPLPKPFVWHHADVYPVFDVWGYSVWTDRARPGFSILENVSRSGFRSSVRERVPDGPLLPATTVRVTTDAFYRAGSPYLIADVNLDSRDVLHSRQITDPEGRLHFLLNGARHEVGILEKEAPVLTATGWSVVGAPWATAGKPVRLRLSILNKGSRMARNIAVTVTSSNPDISFARARFSIAALEAGAESSGDILITVEDPNREIVRLQVRLSADNAEAAEIPISVPLYRNAPHLRDFRIADGRKLPLLLRAIERHEEVLGSGNGDGLANPGETIAIAVPDQDAFRAAELFTSDACVASVGRVSDAWGQYDWVGETAKISLATISSDCPAGHEIPLFVRYRLPNKPEHILKEGVVHVKVVAGDRGK